MTTDERLRRLLGASAEDLAAVDRVLQGKAAVEPEAGPLLLRMADAAEWLGVSRATLWRMIRAGRVEKVEILPNSFRVRRADIEAVVGRAGGAS